MTEKYILEFCFRITDSLIVLTEICYFIINISTEQFFAYLFG